MSLRIWLWLVFDLLFDEHINLLSIFMSIDLPREPALIELANAFPIEVSSIDALFDLTYNRLMTI
jgi:hypothetical protein